MEPARLWKTLDNQAVGCRLCNHFCRIEDGERGKCGVRQNFGGTLYSLVYDRVAALNIDPVEKKPLYHFYPGTKTFSLGTVGCNFFCSFCQNESLSQSPKSGGRIQGEQVTPQQLVQSALDHKTSSISYTYSEPTIFFELIQDTATLAKDRGLKNIMVSNGFMSRECLDELAKIIDAINIDLKAFTEDFYRDQCGARLKPVLDNLKRVRELGWWLEVTTLLIPGLNDSRQELEELTGFMATELGTGIPWHVSRFHPAARMTDRPSTPVETLEMAYEIGKQAGLKYIYLGNVPGHSSETTLCSECGAPVLERHGFTSKPSKTVKGRCPECKADIPGHGLT